MGLIDVPLPKILRPLTKPARYKVLYGGRGGAKSWSIARILLLKGKEKPLRILCTREYQVSIKDSVHQLLSDQIRAMGLEDFYEVKNAEIVGKNGTKFGFLGLHHNIANLKSWEGADVAWVEEAHVVSKASWDILTPTIRKEGSEIWVSFNPDIADDETYQRFVVVPQPDSVVVKINWKDNPWFPLVLEKERLHMQTRDPIAYDNVWEGNPRAAVEGAIFAKDLHRAEQENRITEVEWNPNVPVNTYWDLGKRGKTAIWFCQYVAMEWRVLAHYANFNEEVDHYADYVLAQPYAYGRHFMPHDADHNKLGMVRSLKDQFALRLGWNIEVVPRVPNKATSIAAAKSMLAICKIDRVKCSGGVSDMRHYAFAMDPQTGKISSEPKPDMYSHSSDAFQCFAMAAMPEPVEEEGYVQAYSPRLG